MFSVQEEYFGVPDLETKIQRHNNPHYWLQRVILQNRQFLNLFFSEHYKYRRYHFTNKKTFTFF